MIQSRRYNRRRHSILKHRKTVSSRSIPLMGKETPIPAEGGNNTFEPASTSQSVPASFFGIGRTISPSTQTLGSEMRPKLTSNQDISSGSLKELAGKLMGRTNRAFSTSTQRASRHRRGRSLGLLTLGKSRRRAISSMPPAPAASGAATRKGSVLKKVRSFGSGLRKLSIKVMETNPAELVRTRSRGDTFDSFFSRRSRAGSRKGSVRSMIGNHYLLQTSTGNPIRVVLTENHLVINGHDVMYENIIYWGHTVEFFKVSFVENIYSDDQRRRDLCLYPVNRRMLNEYRKLYLSGSNVAIYNISPSALADLMQTRIAQLLDQESAEETFKEASSTELRTVLRAVDQKYDATKPVDAGRTGRLSSIRELESMFRSQALVPVNALPGVGEEVAATSKSKRTSVGRKRYSRPDRKGSESKTEMYSRMEGEKSNWKGTEEDEWEMTREHLPLAA